MDRDLVPRVIAVVLAGFCVYSALFVPSLLAGPVSPALLIGTIGKAALAGAAAVGVWTGRRWAGAAIVATGVTTAALWIVEGFVLGLVAYLYAVFVAVVAIVLALVAAAFVQHGHRPPRFV